MLNRYLDISTEVKEALEPVSYTHLTLPTIYSVSWARRCV